MQTIYRETGVFCELDCVWCADSFNQPADEVEVEYDTRPGGNSLANVAAVEILDYAHDSHALQEPDSPGAEQNLPSGADSSDRGVPAVQLSSEAAPVDSSAAAYHPASPTNQDSVAETVPHEWRAISEEQGHEEQSHEESVQQQQQQQPGMPAHSATYCMACLSPVRVGVVCEILTTGDIQWPQLSCRAFFGSCQQRVGCCHQCCTASL